MKKKIIALVLGASATLTLASCGGKAKPNFICPEEFDTTQEITIDFWHTMSKTALQPTLDEVIAEFKELYPNITVKHDQIGGYDEVREQIITNMGTHDYPNVAYCYPDHVAIYNEAEITVSLDDVMTNSKYGLGGSELKFTGTKKDEYVKAFLEEGRSFGDGLMYTMPFLKSTEALFYNKDFFTANNLTVPTTWEEMWEVCAKIKEIDPSSTPLGYDSDSNLFITLAETYGYKYTSNNSFDFNNAGMRDLMKTFKENFDKGYFTTQAVYGTYTNELMTDVTKSSRAYMCVGSTAGANYQANADGAFETGIAAVPHAAGKAAKSISQGPSLVLFKNENPQAVLATWLFVQYLNTATVQAKFALASGYLPVTTPATEIPAYKEFLDQAAGNKAGIAALATKQAIAQTDNYFTSAVFLGSSYARDEVGSLLSKIMLDLDINSSNIEKKIAVNLKDEIEKLDYLHGKV
ncbi:MAG: extracellular solute-binding protein, partial [Anaeroplasmataceae bacterium]|nr:extracellular solute-binding protein [Anaeroplasmataceae bacterium]